MWVYEDIRVAWQRLICPGDNLKFAALCMYHTKYHLYVNTYKDANLPLQTHTQRVVDNSNVLFTVIFDFFNFFKIFRSLPDDYRL